MINLILCGGSGTRLWPLSRTMLPKQFVRLFNGESLFQSTVKRNAPLCSHTLIVSNTEQYFLAVDQLEEINASHLTPHSSQPKVKFLLEPVGRNTAPAIALACMTLDADELVFVTTSDHLAKDQAAYEKAVTQAKALAEQNNLVTFGIQPTYPETGFGYIEANGNEVISFHEKPNLETAEGYLEANTSRHTESASPLTETTSPCYLWNSGMFCFKAGVFLKELKQHSPEIYQACEHALNLTQHASPLTENETIRISHEAMSAIPENSIDSAVMCLAIWGGRT
jgi:mannose-1-phosphate guanylyltransferase